MNRGRSIFGWGALAALVWSLTQTGLAGDGFLWVRGDGYRAASLPGSETGRVGFLSLTASHIGIGFTNKLDDRRSTLNRNLLSGSGVALGDVDGDGWCDLYFCGLDAPNRLYRNLGAWRFEDVTEASGLGFAAQDSTGAAFADVDGDGTLDLLVNGLGHGTRLFLNDGRGRFREATAQRGLSSKGGATSLALADIEGDGDLDLYIANFRPTTIKDELTTKFQIQTRGGRQVVAAVNGHPTTLPEYTNRFEFTPSGEVLEFGEPDFLYINDGKGYFSVASFTDGRFSDEEGRALTEPPRDWGLAVQFHDFTGDGAPDIYVCNDLFTPDRIWVNDGKGRFSALPRLALRNTSTFSMGVDFGDLNRDGFVDFFVVDMLSRSQARRQIQMADASATMWPIGLIDNRPQFSRNTLQIGRGDATFAEIAYYAGVEASEWSWGPIFLDVDLDGFEDILVTNGQLRDFQNGDVAERIEAAKASKHLSNLDLLQLMKSFPGLRTPNLIFRNKGDLTFEEISDRWGFATPGISQGMAVGDLDNDGDLDVVTNNLKDAPGVYRNETSAPRVAVRLRGRAPNTAGVGGVIRVTGGRVGQSQEMIAGGRYLSGDQAIRTFAAWSLTNRFDIEVTWRSGRCSTVRGAVGGMLYEIEEPVGAASAPEPQQRDGTEGKPIPLFQDVSDLIRHRHHETAFDDFAGQPLAPNRLSQLGPGVCWHDLDQDGFVDLAVGSGRGGAMGVFRNTGTGTFSRWEGAPLHRLPGRDQTSVLGFGTLLLVGLSNYEDGATNGGYVAVYDFNRKVSGESILGPQFSAGPLVMADVDSDGDLDLFVGGRVIPGRYPEATSSLLMRNDGGRFSVMQHWDKLGLVSGAVFSDLNADGVPELIMAVEWGPVRVFQRGRASASPEFFEEITEKLGLASFTGWWNGVTTGDFDGDGRLDIAASNWGLNTKYRASAAHPRLMYYGDFTGTGRMDAVEGAFDRELGKEVPERGLRNFSTVMPWIRQRFPTHESFAQASLSEIFQDRLKSARRLEAATLESMVFMNRGGRFEARALPREAQWAPAFAVVAGDCDGDGLEDLFVSQNFFAAQPMTSRSDAGRGLWLRGDGKGGFIPMPGQISGVTVYGEQRGAAVADYDGDGRLDLAVTQNGADTHLYRNQGAKRGMRVRLRAGADNPSGVGAAVRMVFGEMQGPVKEVRCGAGYWSQDSAVLVFGMPREASAVWVRWPGGAEATYAAPPGALDIRISIDGRVEKMP